MEKKKPKKRGRKPKNKKVTSDVPVVKKKRGRKPKGGKIIKKLPELQKINQKEEPNIILHLRCHTKDLLTIRKNFFTNPEYDPNIMNVEPLNMNNGTLSKNTLNTYEIESHMRDNKKKSTRLPNLQEQEKEKKTEENDTKSTNQNINDKLKELSIQLHYNEVSGKKSNCFWCTYYFDNPPVHIPARQRHNIIEAYGCFCSPQCAVAYLSKENIDSTTYWERYSLLNNIYGQIYGKNNIKPAPNPFYILDKFYGNLTIQEYRKILNNSQILMIIDKPLTKIFPELHEENYEVPPIFTSMHIKKDKSLSNKLRLKRNKPYDSKTEALNKTFNFS